MHRHAKAAAEAAPPRPLLLSDRGCPYAHRVLALLEHLGVPRDVSEAPFGQLPVGLTRWSPSRRVPLLVHGEVVIGESRVMLEHLAEAYAFAAAYPRELTRRTLARHAMALMDVFIAPALTRLDATLAEGRLAECLDVFEGVAAGAPEPCLLTFHCAPIWLRLQWWHPDHAITRAIRARSKLAAWLDGAAELAAVIRTAPSREENVADFHAACAILGVAPP